jgi:hypothetical protein
MSVVCVHRFVLFYAKEHQQITRITQSQSSRMLSARFILRVGLDLTCIDAFLQSHPSILPTQSVYSSAH